MAFPGSNFALESITQNGLASFRLRFLKEPRHIVDGAVNDACTASNYMLAGPALNAVAEAIPVFEDPLAIDLYLAAPLVTGYWTVTAANIVSVDLEPLSVPSTLSLIVDNAVAQGPVSGGAKNDSTVNLVRKFLSPALKGGGWSAYVSAIAAGDRLIHNNARLAFDQLYLATASNQYLARRASDRGISKPKNVGLTDASFRELAIIESTCKIVPEAVLEVLELFYGEEAVHAYSTCELSEPYCLFDGDDLLLLFNGTEQYAISFARSNFESISSAKAVEIAAVITRQLEAQGSRAYAVAYLDKTDEHTYLRIYSSRKGAGSSVQVIGGRAQPNLRFPTSLFSESGWASIAWTMEVSPSVQSRIRFTATLIDPPFYDLSLVHTGDMACIYGEEWDEVYQGSYEVLEVGTVSVGPNVRQWFEIDNAFGSAALNGGALVITQVDFEDLVIYRPVRRTVYDNPRRVLLSQKSGQLRITMPVTSQIVTRSEEEAAYVNDSAPLTISAAFRNDASATLTSSTNHGLVAGDFVDVAGIWGSDVAPVIPGSPSPPLAGVPDSKPGTTDACSLSCTSQSPSVTRHGQVMCQWEEGVALLIGGSSGAADTSTPILLRVQRTAPTPEGPSYTYEWSEQAVALHTGTIGAKVLRLSNGRVLSYGGRLLDSTLCPGDIITHDEIWAISATAITNGELPPPALTDIALAEVAGSAYIIGGQDELGNPLDTLFLVDINDTSINGVAFMLYARAKAGACGLANGKILIVGGHSVTSTMKSCELYDSSTGLTTLTGTMGYSRYSMGVVKLPDGRVLVLGGRGHKQILPYADAVPLKSCEIYDPQTGLWNSIPDMSTARIDPVASYIASKNVVYVTGTGTGIEYLDLHDYTWHQSNAGSYAGAAAGCSVQDDLIVVTGGSDSEPLGCLIHLANEAYSAQGLNTRLQVATTPSFTSFTSIVNGQGYFGSRSQTATAIRVKAEPVCVGPYLFDEKAGFSVTGVSGATGQILNETQSYSILRLQTSIIDTDPALKFPDREGFLVFAFGESLQTLPVKYFGRQSNTELLIDAGFKFPQTLPTNTTVTLVQRSPYTQLAHAFWLTDSVAGRLAAIAALEDTIAAGIDVELLIEYPDDRGLGNAGCLVSGVQKLSDKVWIWGGDNPDSDLEIARSG